MTITLKVFASIRDICGFNEKEINITPGTTIESLMDGLVNEYPALESRRKSLLIAVNEEYTTGSKTLSDRDVVAVFPPVSGG